MRWGRGLLPCPEPTAPPGRARDGWARCPQPLQVAQHLVEVVDPVDVELRGGLGLGRLVLHRGHEEHGGARPLDRNGLLGHPAHVADDAVGVHGAGGRDHVVAGELAAAHLVDDAQRHGQPGRGPPISGVLMVTVHREVPVLLRLGQDAEGGGGRAPAVGIADPVGGVPSVTALSTVLPGRTPPGC